LIGIKNVERLFALFPFIHSFIHSLNSWWMLKWCVWYTFRKVCRTYIV